jgi:hypothetical protein
MAALARLLGTAPAKAALTGRGFEPSLVWHKRPRQVIGHADKSKDRVIKAR